MAEPAVRQRIEPPPPPELDSYRPKPKQTQPESDRRVLDKLLENIEVPGVSPQIGIAAAQAMHNCFEQTARDIEQLALDGVDRAMAIQQEAKVFADVLRESGKVLCDRIEAEAARGAQISEVMRVARSAVLATPSGMAK